VNTKLSDLGESSDYTSNLLGNIRSHLQGLQGFDTMALELIQNADDAKAKEIIFDVQDNGLFVWNSGTFSYCGDLGMRPCPHFDNDGYSCDFHRISDFGSGGKLSKSENIGRFGIGFSSTYQIADKPEIHSSGVKVTLVPEDGKCYRKPDSNKNGTTFFLPWASDPNSSGRQALGVSHITSAHIDQLVSDCENVLQRSMLFLRHLEKAELRQNGKLLLAVELDRGDDDELIVSFEPKDEIERWFIFRADAATQAKPVYDNYPQLEPLNRKTEVSLAIRVEPKPLTEGLLYAFLPTKQSTGLPFHLNADFFPEGSRKAVIFEGHQYQQEWNELLVKTAAESLAKDLEKLRDKLGHLQLWQLLTDALKVDNDKNELYPNCLKSFWQFLKLAIEGGAKVGYSSRKKYEPPSKLLMPNKSLSKDELSAFHKISGNLLNDSLRPYRNTYLALGVKDLTLKHFMEIANTSVVITELNKNVVKKDCINSLLLPLWSISEQLIKDTDMISPKLNPSVNELMKLDFVVNVNNGVTNINACYKAPGSITGKELASSFKFLTFINDQLKSFPKLFKLVDSFIIGSAATELEAWLEDDSNSFQELSGGDTKLLSTFYDMLARLDEQGEIDEEAYETLKTLPIWMTGDGLSSAEYALLPGNFEDPTGQAELLETSFLSTRTRNFVEHKLNVKSQTVDAFIRTVVPQFMGTEGPDDLAAYQRLIVNLSNHAGLLDNDELRMLLSETLLIPSMDGGWQKTNHVYFQTDELISLLGNNKSIWIDKSRLHGSRSVTAFINNLGVLQKPIAAHLTDRLLGIAEAFSPDVKARKSSEKVFYELCDIYQENQSDSSISNSVSRLLSISCLPVDGDFENWHIPQEIYAPFRYQAFSSQAAVLDFKNTQRINSDLKLLSVLGISIRPETQLVVDHLLYCVEKGLAVNNVVYQVLNERARDSDTEIYQLCGTTCIYLNTQKRYVRPNQLYLIPQQLGKHSFSVPSELDQYKVLFSQLGVKDEPEASDYVYILLDIINEFYPKQISLPNKEQAIYENCMQNIVFCWDSNCGVEDRDIDKLREAPSVLNMQGMFCHPDELLIHDSEWHASHFGDDLLPALTKPNSEWWPFFKELGVNNLTKMARVELDFFDGLEQNEKEITELIIERCDVFVRMLHDKKSTVREKLVQYLQKLSVKSYDIIRVVASVTLSGNLVTSEPRPVKAFYEESEGILILVRPIEDLAWLHIFNSILHSIMPSESAADISHLGMNFAQIIKMSVSEANEYLTEANFPFLEIEQNLEQGLDLTSPELGGLGLDSEDDTVIQENESEQETNTGVRNNVNDGDNQKVDGLRNKSDVNNKNNMARKNDKNTNKQLQGEDTNSFTDPPINEVKGKPKKRGSHKKLWDRKLISYVKKLDPDKSSDLKESSVDRDFKLSIEVASRDIVCAYESERGRDPEEMAQTHPGYDIISCIPETGEIARYIEVKGTSGEWMNRGVSVSRLQFSEAQNYGDQYWLYVVEHALEKDKARMYAIQNPSMKVDSFMFDGEWRKVAINENADPTLRFKTGVTIDCQNLGRAIIEKVEKRGQTISLIVNFLLSEERKYMPLNLRTMQIVEEKNGLDDS
jgi:hypothetical protein